MTATIIPFPVERCRSPEPTEKNPWFFQSWDVEYLDMKINDFFIYTCFADDADEAKQKCREFYRGVRRIRITGVAARS